ncbi:MAG TPA: site-specific integrase [Acidimicrobiales bacterium]|nr:site-specific integrase [Acidimicrobiales bacterium]
MSAQAARTLAVAPVRWARPEPTWDEIEAIAPQMVATMRRYLGDLGALLKPASVKAAEVVLRHFAGRVTQADVRCASVAAIRRRHVEDYLVWLRARPGATWGTTVSEQTVDHRLGLLVAFFERALSWGYGDVPAAIPIRASDRPKVARPPRRPNSARPAPAAKPVAKAKPRRTGGEVSWEEVARRAPQMATTMRAYLDQLAVSARPATVVSANKTLRLFAGHVSDADPACRCVAGIGRGHVEDYKVWLAARPGTKAATLSASTIRNCLGTLRTFFERIIEWGYDDAPARVPVYANDLPRADEPLPRFLDDPTAAKFMATLATDPNPRRRLVVELLARTGMRVGELADLEDDAVVRIGETFWLRIPVGKLHNDRHVPLHPLLVELITDYRARRGPSFSGRLVERDDGSAFDACAIRRYVETIARRAGIGHVHPHQLRHTLATQAINRGMSLEAIAALLGHRSMRMTLTYARISDRTVAEEYFKVTEAVEARYQGNDRLPANGDEAGAQRQAADAHRRLLGNGHCTRPVALDCQFESICDRCGFFETGADFVPVLLRQRGHAADRGQHERATLFDGLLSDVEEGSGASFG